MKKNIQKFCIFFKILKKNPKFLEIFNFMVFSFFSIFSFLENSNLLAGSCFRSFFGWQFVKPRLPPTSDFEQLDSEDAKDLKRTFGSTTDDTRLCIMRVTCSSAPTLSSWRVRLENAAAISYSDLKSRLNIRESSVPITNAIDLSYP